MNRSLGLVSLLVRDYDEAIGDTTLGAGKRWVHVGAESGAELLLAQAAGPQQQAAVGTQAGGRVFLFLQTDDFSRDSAAITKRGIKFREAPRHEPYGTVAVFLGLCGNSRDLLQTATGAS